MTVNCFPGSQIFELRRVTLTNLIFDIVSLNFEGVVAISSLPLEPRDQGSGQVGRHEKDSPAFVLMNVDAFMLSGKIDSRFRLTKNDMSDGDSENSVVARGEASNEERGKATPAFKDSIAKLHTPASE